MADYCKGGNKVRVILEKAVANMDKAFQVAVGFLEGATEEDGVGALRDLKGGRMPFPLWF